MLAFIAALPGCAGFLFCTDPGAGGISRSGASDFFDVEKVTKKTPKPTVLESLILRLFRSRPLSGAATPNLLCPRLSRVTRCVGGRATFCLVSVVRLRGCRGWMISRKGAPCCRLLRIDAWSSLCRIRCRSLFAAARFPGLAGSVRSSFMAPASRIVVSRSWSFRRKYKTPPRYPAHCRSARQRESCVVASLSRAW